MVHSALTWYTVASWKKPVWYSLTYSVMFDDVIARLEKVNVGGVYWQPGTFQPGMWEHDTPYHKVLEKLKK